MTAARGNCPSLRRTYAAIDDVANGARLSWRIARKGVSRKIHSEARRASIFHDGFFDDIGVDFSVRKHGGINHFRVISIGTRVSFRKLSFFQPLLIYKYLFEIILAMIL